MCVYVQCQPDIYTMAYITISNGQLYNYMTRIGIIIIVFSGLLFPLFLLILLSVMSLSSCSSLWWTSGAFPALLCQTTFIFCWSHFRSAHYGKVDGFFISLPLMFFFASYIWYTQFTYFLIACADVIAYRSFSLLALLFFWLGYTFQQFV